MITFSNVVDSLTFFSTILINYKYFVKGKKKNYSFTSHQTEKLLIRIK